METVPAIPEREKARRYWWRFLSVFGEECYKTWRQELLASAIASIATFFITWANDTLAWSTLRTALRATAITLAVFAIWHLVKVPYLLTHPREKPHKLAGYFGVFIVLCLMAGAASVAVVVKAHWSSTVTPRAPPTATSKPEKPTEQKAADPTPQSPSKPATPDKQPPAGCGRTIPATPRGGSKPPAAGGNVAVGTGANSGTLTVQPGGAVSFGQQGGITVGQLTVTPEDLTPTQLDYYVDNSPTADSSYPNEVKIKITTSKRIDNPSLVLFFSGPIEMPKHAPFSCMMCSAQSVIDDATGETGLWIYWQQPTFSRDSPLSFTLESVSPVIITRITRGPDPPFMRR